MLSAVPPTYLELWLSPGAVYNPSTPAPGDPEDKECSDVCDPYNGFFACPCCGEVKLLTPPELHGLQSVICSSDTCSEEYFVRKMSFKIKKVFAWTVGPGEECLVEGTYLDTRKPQ